MASLIIVLFGCEIGARILLSDIGTTGNRTDYFSQRWYTSHPPQKNRLGFRDRDFTPMAQPGIFRIAIIGDSFTYGAGIMERDRVSDRLDELLNRREHRYEVLNFGVPGANYAEHRANMAVAIRASHPHFILLQWYLNDVDDPQTRRPDPKQPGWILHEPLSRSSALYMLLSHAFADAQIRLGLVDPDAYYARFRNPRDELAQRADARLAEVLNVARAAAIPIAIYIWPELGRPIGLSPNDGLIDKLLERCHRERIACVDLRPALAAVSDRKSLIVNRFDAHASAYANQLASDVLLRRFGPAWEQQSRAATAGNQQPRKGKP